MLWFVGYISFLLEGQLLGVMVNAWAVKRENAGLNMESSPTIKRKEYGESHFVQNAWGYIYIPSTLLAPYN